jgi:type I site-specific restriction endonuclease
VYRFIAEHSGIAIREFPMKPGFGEADYLLYVDGQALGVVEAKKEGSTLTGFEGQTAKYSEGFLILYLPPSVRFHSAIKAPGSKLASQISSNPTQPAAMFFHSIGQRRWRSG